LNFEFEFFHTHDFPVNEKHTGMGANSSIIKGAKGGAEVGYVIGSIVPVGIIDNLIFEDPTDYEDALPGIGVLMPHSLPGKVLAAPVGVAGAAAFGLIGSVSGLVLGNS
jgi:hypothetical protein